MYHLGFTPNSFEIIFFFFFIKCQFVSNIGDHPSYNDRVDRCPEQLFGSF
jgi:hypothetical protein